MIPPSIVGPALCFHFSKEEERERGGGVRLLDEIDEYVDGSFLPFPQVELEYG